ncbi:MAG: hypothetical protein AAB837_02595 [Patescibacteria group bacterium]
MNNKIFILIFIVVVFILGGLLYIYNPDPVEYKRVENNSATTTP